jgi:hypothetical protein
MSWSARPMASMDSGGGQIAAEAWIAAEEEGNSGRRLHDAHLEALIRAAFR